MYKIFICSCVLTCFIVFVGFLAIDEKIELIQSQIQHKLVLLEHKRQEIRDILPRRDFNSVKDIDEWNKKLSKFIKFADEQDAGLYMEGGDNQLTFLAVYLYKNKE